jgi:hypothetical protein
MSEKDYTIKVPLTLRKSTKGTHVFANEELGFSGIYVPKSLFPDGVTPNSIMMTLTSND